MRIKIQHVSGLKEGLCYMFYLKGEKIVFKRLQLMKQGQVIAIKCF